MELFAEEPHATFLQRNTWADLSKLLAAAGLNPELARRYVDCNGKTLQVTL